MENAMYLATVNLFPTWLMKNWALESKARIGGEVGITGLRYHLTA